MVESMQNPKPEGRIPKEGRNPKAEPDAPTGTGELAAAKSRFWDWGDEPTTEPLVFREEPPGSDGPPQDLVERTAVFGEKIIEFAKKIPENPVNNRLISQLVGAGTSVGANYCEADEAVSGKEFKQKIGTCRKEAKETMFFLRMIAKSEPSLTAEARKHWREAKELNLIFGAIWRK